MKNKLFSLNQCLRCLKKTPSIKQINRISSLLRCKAEEKWFKLKDFILILQAGINIRGKLRPWSCKSRCEPNTPSNFSINGAMKFNGSNSVMILSRSTTKSWWALPNKTSNEPNLPWYTCLLYFQSPILLIFLQELHIVRVTDRFWIWHDYNIEMN